MSWVQTSVMMVISRVPGDTGCVYWMEDTHSLSFSLALHCITSRHKIMSRKLIQLNLKGEKERENWRNSLSPWSASRSEREMKEACNGCHDESELFVRLSIQGESKWGEAEVRKKILTVQSEVNFIFLTLVHAVSPWLLMLLRPFLCSLTFSTLHSSPCRGNWINSNTTGDSVHIKNNFIKPVNFGGGEWMNRVKLKNNFRQQKPL